MSSAALEGDDIPAEPLRVNLYGPYFAATDRISAQGERPLRTLAQSLFDNGIEAGRELEIYRGGELVSRSTIAAEAGIET